MRLNKSYRKICDAQSFNLLELAEYIVQVRGNNIFYRSHCQDVLTLKDHHHDALDRRLKGVVHALETRLDRVIKHRDLEAGDLDVPDLVLVALRLCVNIQTERDPKQTISWVGECE